MEEPRVRDAMFPSPLVVHARRPLADALAEMERIPIGAAPVITDDGTLKGVLVKRDGIEALRQRIDGSLTVEEVCRSGRSARRVVCDAKRMRRS
jgi:CBS domain-containing protein